MSSENSSKTSLSNQSDLYIHDMDSINRRPQNSSLSEHDLISINEDIMEPIEMEMVKRRMEGVKRYREEIQQIYNTNQAKITEEKPLCVPNSKAHTDDEVECKKKLKKDLTDGVEKLKNVSYSYLTDSFEYNKHLKLTS